MSVADLSSNYAGQRGGLNTLLCLSRPFMGLIQIRKPKEQATDA